MSATITLPVDAKLQGLLAQKAAAQGINVEEFAVEALRKIAELPDDPWELFADVREEVAQRGITEEQLEAEIKAAIKEVRTRNSDQ